MTNFEDNFLKQVEIQFAADDVALAADADTIIVESALRAGAAEAESLAAKSDADRVAAEVELHAANTDCIRAMGRASRLDWEIGQMLDAPDEP